MSIQAVLLPVFVLMGLTFGRLLWTNGARRAAPPATQANASDIEMPLLFLVLIALALPIRHADLVIVLLSWVFVVTRFAHAGILLTSNNAQRSSMAWFAGVLVLFAMWLYFALRILLLI
jgi:hypothetical protein